LSNIVTFEMSRWEEGSILCNHIPTRISCILSRSTWWLTNLQLTLISKFLFDESGTSSMIYLRFLPIVILVQLVVDIKKVFVEHRHLVWCESHLTVISTCLLFQTWCNKMFLFLK